MSVKKIRSGLVLFRLALKGDPSMDYTRGSIARATFLLAIPMILEMAMESLFAIVDIFFVARLGAEAVATVGLTEAVLTLLYAMAMGLSMGTTALVARRIGERNPQLASSTATQALWLAAMVSVLVGLAGMLYGRDILRLMGADASLIETGHAYTRIMFGSSWTIMFLFLINAIFRGAGDASLAMRTLLLANGINIILDPCLIFGLGPFPEMGVTGAAVATNIGRGVGAMYGLVCLCRTGNRIRLQIDYLRLQFNVLWSILRVSAGGILQMLIATASWVFLVRIVSAFGGDAVAGYTIAVRILIFIILPAFGLSNAVATLVGQNLGAGEPQRAEQTVWKVMQYVSAYMLFTMLVLWVATDAIIGMFTSDPEVAAHARLCLRIISLGLLPFGFSASVVQAFNGAGDTWTPSWINFLCFWIIQVPLAFLLARILEIGPVGVFWAVFVSDLLAGIVALLVFRRGRWKRQMV